MTYDHETDDVTEGQGPEAESASPTNGLYSSAEDDSDAPIEFEAGGSDELESASEAAPEMVGDVRAESVTISQGGANSVEAKTVSITQGGAAQVRADDLSVSQGGVALARTGNLSVDEGGSAFAVMADSATVHEGGNVFMLIARSAEGAGRPFLDWRAALAFGAGLALVLRLLRGR